MEDCTGAILHQPPWCCFGKAGMMDVGAGCVLQREGAYVLLCTQWQED